CKLLRLTGRHWPAHRWQLYLYNCAARLGVARRDFATVLLHNSIADAQAQAGALAHTLRRIERLENPAWFLDAGARILEFHMHPVDLGKHSHLEAPLLRALLC